MVCDDTCSSAIDGVCDDGGTDSRFSSCDLGTDCTDCGDRDPCTDNCTPWETSSYAGDGDCDDGRSDVSPEGAEASAEACTDGLDNDCDGLVDLDDEDCREFADDDSVGGRLQGGGCSYGIAPTSEVDLSRSVALGLLVMLGLWRRRAGSP